MIKKTHSPTKKLTIVSGLIFSATQSRKCTRQYKNKTAHTITPIVFTKAHNIVDTVDMVFNFNSFTNFVLRLALYNVATCFVCYNLESCISQCNNENTQLKIYITISNII